MDWEIWEAKMQLCSECTKLTIRAFGIVAPDENENTPRTIPLDGTFWTMAKMDPIREAYDWGGELVQPMLYDHEFRKWLADLQPAEGGRLGGRPRLYDWDAWWAEAVRWLIDPANGDRRTLRTLRNHLYQWTTDTMGDNAPSDDAMRKKLNLAAPQRIRERLANGG